MQVTKTCNTFAIPYVNVCHMLSGGNNYWFSQVLCAKCLPCNGLHGSFWRTVFWFLSGLVVNIDLRWHWSASYPRWTCPPRTSQCSSFPRFCFAQVELLCWWFHGFEVFCTVLHVLANVYLPRSVFAGTDIVRLQLVSNSHECCQHSCAVTFRVVVRSMQYRLVAKCTEVVAGIEESPEGHYTNKT